MAFLKKEIKFIVKFFWPHRSEVEGFSIENLARKHRDKISSVASKKVSNQLLDNRNLNTMKGHHKNSLSLLSIRRVHWANRDFSEYKEPA